MTRITQRTLFVLRSILIAAMGLILFVFPAGAVPVITGVPDSPTTALTATLVVSGEGYTHYRYRLDEGTFGPETSISEPVVLTNHPEGGSQRR